MFPSHQLGVQLIRLGVQLIRQHISVTECVAAHTMGDVLMLGTVLNCGLGRVGKLGGGSLFLGYWLGRACESMVRGSDVNGTGTRLNPHILLRFRLTPSPIALPNHEIFSDILTNLLPYFLHRM